MRKGRKTIGKGLRTSGKASFLDFKKTWGAKKDLDGIQPVDRCGNVLKVGDKLISHIMPEPEPIAFVHNVFPDGSYQFGWLDNRCTTRDSADRIVGRERQSTVMWIKADA